MKHFLSGLQLTYALMDYPITWYKCCPHLDLDLGPYLKRPSSPKTLKGQSTHTHVCTITYLCIDGLPYNYPLCQPPLRLVYEYTKKTYVPWKRFLRENTDLFMSLKRFESSVQVC